MFTFKFPAGSTGGSKRPPNWNFELWDISFYFYVNYWKSVTISTHCLPIHLTWQRPVEASYVKESQLHVCAPRLCCSRIYQKISYKLKMSPLGLLRHMRMNNVVFWLRVALEKIYGIIWEFFPNGGHPPTPTPNPPFGNPLFKKQN